MITAMTDAFPLMNVTRMSDLAPQYQTAAQPESMSTTLVIGAMVLVAITAAIGFWWWKSMQQTDIPDSDSLTMELCRAHGLSMNHRGLIDRLAKAAGVDHAAEMFLSKSHFDAIIGKAGESMRLRRHHQASLSEVRRILFPA